MNIHSNEDPHLFTTALMRRIQTTMPRSLILMWIVFLAALFLMGFGGRIQGQEEDYPTIEHIKEIYNQFQYDEVVSLCQRALAAVPPPAQQEQIEIYTHLAFSYIALGKTDEAKLAFKSALQIDPGLFLDPIYVSPKIIAIFDEVKTEQETGQETVELEPQDTALTSDMARLRLRREGAWRSLVVPGWGQLHKGQKRKAVAIFIAQSINVGTLLYAHLKMQQAHTNYLEAREPATIESTYDRYNAFYKLRNYCILSTAAVWLYAHIDAAISSPASTGDHQQNERTHIITPTLTSNSMGVVYIIQF